MRQKATAPTTQRFELPEYQDEHTATLRVQLLGEFQVTAGGRVISDSAWRVQRARSLVKVLCLAAQQRLHREQVVDLLWPDMEPEAVSGNVRSVVHAARRALDSHRPSGATTCLQIRQDIFILEADEGLTVDVNVFQAAAQAAFNSGNLAAYHAAIELYVGDLLPEDRYEDWTTSAREDLRETYLQLLISLALLHESRNEYEAGITALQRVIATDPTHEDAHAGLMRLFATTGRHGQALRQYARLADSLLHELDVEPSGTTQRLHAEIAAGLFPAGDVALYSSHSATSIASDAGLAVHNLPAPLTTFIGRQQELGEIGRHLRVARLVTLVGPGGSGKSRLALESAMTCVANASSGVWLVELAPLNSPDLLPGAVATVLGIREQSDRSLIDSLVQTLQAGSQLLVLDNCEHLVGACARLVETLLAGCPNLRILATSRELLRVPGEVGWRVPPLPVPSISPGTGPGHEQLATNDAVALFVDRARWVQSGFTLTESNAAAVAQICQRLDGMPLALELAAARCSVLTPGQLAARLDDALPLLSEGSRTAPDRQQTLRATLDWSYALLVPEEQTLLQRLAVFTGGWTLEAAEIICSDETADSSIKAHNVLQLLAHLVDKSLVQVEDSSTGTDHVISPGVRYRLLETVRQYAAGHLNERGETDRVRSQHADYYIQLAERAEPALIGPDQVAWLARLEQEHDNLRAALVWLAEHADLERESRLCVDLWRFWYFHNYLVEGTRWIEGILARRGADTIPEVRTARLLQGAGMLAWNRGDIEQAEGLSLQALMLFQKAGERTLSAGAFHNLGAVAELQSKYLEAEQHYREALRLREEIGDVAGSAYTLHNLGNLAREQGDLENAAALYERELVLQRETGNTRGEALALSGLGVVALDQGDYALSETLSSKSLELYQELGVRSLNAMVFQNLGLAMLHQGKYAQAMDCQIECFQITVQSGDKRGIACGIEGVAITIPLYDPTIRGARAAARLFGAADALRKELNVPLPPADFALLERPLIVARERLGPEEYERALAAGGSLSLEAAIAEAQSLIGSLPEQDDPPLSTTPEALSQRERDVVSLLAQGRTNAQIATTLNIARPTVDKHVSNILRKLQFSSRSEVQRWAIDQGLLPDAPR